MKVEKVDETLKAFDSLDEKDLPELIPGKQIFVNSSAGKVLMNLGTVALEESAGTNERLNLGARLLEFYYQDQLGELSLAQVSENVMYWFFCNTFHANISFNGVLNYVWKW